jgi:asparagine synthase (glutamine-hydrolysing)
VFTRFKRGFGVPISQWLRQELMEYFSDMVLAENARNRAFVNDGIIERLFREHCRKEFDHSLVLWQTLVLEIWLRLVERGFVKPQ